MQTRLMSRRCSSVGPSQLGWLSNAQQVVPAGQSQEYGAPGSSGAATEHRRVLSRAPDLLFVACYGVLV
jgi:hypothetical protein